MYALPRHILVLEDDYFQAERMAIAISERGDKVVGPFSSSAQAMPHIHRADAAILDIRLKGDLCFKVADRCKQMLQPFVFISAFGTRDVPLRFAFDTFFTKPCEADIVLDDLCERWGPQQTVPVGSIEAVLPFLLARAKKLMPDQASSERLVEAALKAAIAAVGRDELPADIVPWLFDLLEDEFLLRGRDHLL
ncbi:response regulator [Salipiger sp. PrR007]|uniref:response regulator n=1 Tax=Salipiger sp. PrR007 TaxID=2706884 RepID=UPI0013B6D87C|nr:response regulator [Salipiger sp. PrR007]NDW32734.1 response regulator [Salipiger sp. PrR007]